MKKLKLHADDLQVSSFQADPAAQANGTVYAARATVGEWTCGIWCPPTTDPAVTGPCAC